MEPEMIVALLEHLPDLLPDKAWARDIMAWVTLVMTFLTALGKSLNFLVPWFRDFADHTAAKWDDKVADRVEWFAEKLALVNSKIPHTKIGTHREDARPSMRPPKPRGGSGVTGLIGLILIVSCAGTLSSCTVRHTQTALNVSGEFLYGVDDAIQPWVSRETNGCLDHIRELPDSVDFDYESEFSECMSLPLAIGATMEAVRTGISEANQGLAEYRAGNRDDLPCDAIGRMRIALNQLLTELDQIQGFNVPAAPVDAVTALAESTCEQALGVNQ